MFIIKFYNPPNWWCKFLLIWLRLFLNFWDFLALSEYGMVLLVQILKGRA